MSELALPEGWVKTEISNIAEVIAGGTPSSKKPDYFCEPGTDISWLTPADLTGYEKIYISHGRRDITESGYNSSSAKLMPKGSVVFSSRAPIGYVAIAEKDLSTNQGFKSFVIPEELSSEYLYFYLKSIKGLAESLGTGTTFKELSGRACKKLPLVMAPLAEQKVIASTLESYLTTVFQIQARLDAIPKLIEKFRQSVLNDAVSGKLTEEWRTANNIEFDWQEKKLGSIAKEVKYGLTASSTNIDTGIKFVRITDLHKNNINWDSVPYCEATTEEIEKYKLSKGDLLFARTGATVGKSYLLKKDPENAVFASYLIKVSMDEEHNEEYLELFFQSLNYWSQISTLKSGIGQPSVNGTKLKGLLIPLPTLNEQNEIVLQTKKLLEIANNIEKSVATAKARVDNLTQSILHQAFTGQLTKEWREQNSELISGDNSAEALLAKIKAEKKASGRKAKAKK